MNRGAVERLWSRTLENGSRNGLIFLRADPEEANPTRGIQKSGTLGEEHHWGLTFPVSNSNAAAALRAFEDVKGENSFHQGGPCVIPGLTYPGLLPTFALRMGFVFPCREAGVGDGL